MSHLRLAVFDVDGTLIDSQHNIITAMTEAWAALGIGVPRPEQVRRIIGLSLTEACAAMLPWASPSTHRAVAEAYKDAFRALRLLPDSTEPLFSGVVNALDTLEAGGWLLGIATGKSRRALVPTLEAHGLEDRFVTIQTADDNPGKPHPGMLLRAAREVGADAGDMVMVGDTSYDMLMANAANVAALGVSWGYHSLDELRKAGARAVIDSFDDLDGILATLGRGSKCV
ncbi:MAG: HAD family hydrolase [Magnetospirillum sp.]|nr:HAD family hydrolase [Magnetospirillum sp.]